jgi:membrane protein required for colicin V production
MLIDLIVVLLIAVFFALGILQGFIVSLLTLAAWVVGIISVWIFSGSFASMLSKNVSFMPPLDLLLGAVLAFFIPFLLIRITATFIKYFMAKTSSLTVANRILGGVWGLLKGVVIAWIFLTAINLLPVKKGNLQHTMDKSITYSIYKTLPFASLWEDFRLPKSIELSI